ncbi:unnamed protein product, partial [Penicillium salamii]
AGSQKPDDGFISRFQNLYGKVFTGTNADTKQPSQSLNKDNETHTNDFHFVDPFAFDQCQLPVNVDSSGDETWMQPQAEHSKVYPSGSESFGIFNNQGAPEGSPPDHWSSSSQSSMDSSSNCVQNAALPQLFDSIDPFKINAPSLQTQFTQDTIDYASMNTTNSTNLDRGMGVSPRMTMQTGFQDTAPSESRDSGDKESFRYQTVLQAPTAIINYQNEVPISYLNKSQVYYITVTDSMAPFVAEAAQFRTFIRISFEEEHRRNSAARWQLWKDGRESTESKRRELPPMAVQYAGQGDQMLVEQANLDGFSIIWSTLANGANRCSIPVRFNFLSTDFTLAKGVKGESVRLCVKTERIQSPDIAPDPEISFCQVKLFRDHGAERKMSNDVAIIHKRMERLKLQIKYPDQTRTSKHRRDSTPAGGLGQPNDRYQKMRGNSLGSLPNGLTQEQLKKFQQKLDALQWALRSSKPETVFSLRADHHDDPDLHPRLSVDTSKIQVHNPLHQSIPAVQESISPKSRSSDCSEFKMPRTVSQLKKLAQPAPTKHYRAIYPKERTVLELKKRIAESDPTISVDSRIYHVNKANLQIVVDDEFVQHIAEGQDMVVQILDAPDLSELGECPTPSKDLCLIY